MSSASESMILFYIPYSSFARGRKDRRNCSQKDRSWDLLGGLAVETLCFHCQGLGLCSILVGELRFPMSCGAAKKLKKTKKQKKKHHPCRGGPVDDSPGDMSVVTAEPCYIHSQR